MIRWPLGLGGGRAEKINHVILDVCSQNKIIVYVELIFFMKKYRI